MGALRGSMRGIATCWASLRARDDVVRPRLLGSILAFDLKGEAGYQSAQSQALKGWFLAHGLNIRPLGPTVYLHAALLHHRRRARPAPMPG